MQTTQIKNNKINPGSVASYDLRPGNGRKGRDGQKKKTSKANERKRKVKRGKDGEVNEQGEKGVPPPHTGDQKNKIAGFGSQSPQIITDCVFLVILLAGVTTSHQNTSIMIHHSQQNLYMTGYFLYR